MKSIDDVQNAIKNKEKLCIFVDYKTIKEELSEKNDTEIFDARKIRIANNFAKCPFLTVYLIIYDKLPAKEIKFLGKKLENISILKYEETELKNTINLFDDTYKFIYIGNNLDILKEEKLKNGYTITINPQNNKVKKASDIQLSKQKFEELLIETNNICL